MARIFLSYNRQNEAIARTLAEDIEALSHVVWFDQELRGGQSWWDQILATIRNCEVFVFLLDPKALKSTACQREYSYAADLGKLILPILVAEGISTNLLPPALSQIQFVDYRKPDRDALRRLAKALTTLPPPRPLPDPLPHPPEVPISYLGSLAERIEAMASLDYEKQSALVVDLKGGLRDPESFDDAHALLVQLRKRRDLFAIIAEEIDEVLRSLRTADTAATPAPEPALPPQPPSLPPHPQPHAETPGPPRAKGRDRGGRATVVADRLPKSITGKDGAEMVLVPAGEFWMGSGDGDDLGDEGPRHRLALRAFYIDKHPVTNAQYKRFLSETGHREPEYWSNQQFNQPDQPAVGVAWDDAQAYCRWAGERLPTEAEWEKTARGPDGRKYPWGNKWDAKRANSKEGGAGKPTPFGSYPEGESPYGAHDMAGNIWEWTSSLYRPYPYQADDGREDSKSQDKRVVRGGSWEDGPRTLRVSCRAHNSPSSRNFNVGFRCARDVSP